MSRTTSKQLYHTLSIIYTHNFEGGYNGMNMEDRIHVARQYNKTESVDVSSSLMSDVYLLVDSFAKMSLTPLASPTATARRANPFTGGLE